MLTSLRRIVKTGFINFWRNAYVASSSIFVLTVTLFVIGSAMFFNQLLITSLSIIQSKVDINVYFDVNASSEDVNKIISELKTMPDVKSVEYIPKDVVYERYRERNKDNKVVMQALEELDGNPMGDVAAIQAKDPSKYQKISDFLESKKKEMGGVIDNINYLQTKKAIDKLTTIINVVKKATFVIAGVLLVAAVLITFNTIRLAIYTAREEIVIMRLVGAGNSFIRGPFLLQGMFYGFISACIAMLIFYPILTWLGPRTEVFFGLNIYDYYIDNLSNFFVVLAGFGVVLGFVSSFLAVSRYLRV